MLGYTLALAKANKAASGRELGVKLGRACIRKDVPVQEVAKKFSVSRQTVYNWFRGRRQPRATLHSKLEAYIASLSE